MKENILCDKSEDFSVRIVNLYKHLTFKRREYVMSKQLIRSGTSVGANVIEAQSAQSKKDFLSKMGIALKECKESMYWIRVLHRTEFLSSEEYKSIYTDAEELFKMLTALIKTTRQNIEHEK